MIVTIEVHMVLIETKKVEASTKMILLSITLSSLLITETYIQIYGEEYNINKYS